MALLEVVAFAVPGSSSGVAALAGVFLALLEVVAFAVPGSSSGVLALAGVFLALLEVVAFAGVFLVLLGPAFSLSLFFEFNSFRCFFVSKCF